MKIGLYSITYLGIWYRGGALALGDFLTQARKLGYSGVEIDGKRPHGNPADLSAGARREIRTIAADQGLEIPAVASNNDFSSPVPDQLECQVLMVREQIKLAADLGAKVVRLFLAWPGVTYRADGLAQYDVARRRWEEIWRDTTRYEIWQSAREAFKEVAHVAEEEGVVLALQNHGPVIRHHHDVLDMVAEVDSPAFKVCLDAPLLTSQTDAAVRAAALGVGSLQVHSHFGGEYRRNADGRIEQRPLNHVDTPVNYPVFAQTMRDIGYDGYICYEFCHVAMDDRHQVQDRRYVDEQAALAREYMQSVVHGASAPRAIGSGVA